MFYNMYLWLTCLLFQLMQPQQGAKALNILPELAIREEIKANICSITLELKYIHQVLRCLENVYLKRGLSNHCAFSVSFLLKKSKK